MPPLTLIALAVSCLLIVVVVLENSTGNFRDIPGKTKRQVMSDRFFIHFYYTIFFSGIKKRMQIIKEKILKEDQSVEMALKYFVT